jgi:hypothetical protein
MLSRVKRFLATTFSNICHASIKEAEFCPQQQTTRSDGNFYPREHAMLARVYILLFVVGVVVVVVVVDALLNYCEFRHGCTSSSLLRISSWLQVG